MIRTAALNILLLASFFCAGQSPEIDLQCIVQDTLFWDIETDGCVIERFSIYKGAENGQNFVILFDSTKSPGNKFFDSAGSGSEERYFLSIVFDCFRPAFSYSDTISERLPDQIAVISASVVEEGVHLTWNASDDPKVDAYIIYRQTNLGTFPIDTVYADTQYVDQEVIPSLMSVTYFVSGLDQCGRSSFFSPPHKTIFLQISEDSCQDSQVLRWSPYEAWISEVQRNPQIVLDSQEVWYKAPNRQSILIAKLDPTDTLFRHAYDQIQGLHCYEVRNKLASGVNVVSNTKCTEIKALELDQPRWYNITYTEDDDLAVFWRWPKESDHSKARLTVNHECDSSPIEIDLSRDEFDRDYIKYEISKDSVVGCRPKTSMTFIHDCKDPFSLEEIFPPEVELITNASEKSNLVRWDFRAFPNTTLSHFEVYLLENGIEKYLGETSADIFQFEHNNPTNALKTPQCYIVKANFYAEGVLGSTELIISRSFPACINPASQIFVPNAFSPNGRNKIFKPVGNLVDLHFYKFSIYDRWGNSIFETNDIRTGWNGTYKGRLLEHGVYVYRIEYQQKGSDISHLQGPVVLIR